MAKNQKTEVSFATLNAVKVLEGNDSGSIVGFPLQAINLGTLNFYLGCAVNRNPILQPKKEQTEIQKKFASLLNLESERPLALNDEMKLEEDKKVSEADKLESALAGIKATQVLGNHISEVFQDSDDKVASKMVEFELKGGNLGGGLQTAHERLVSQGLQWASTRIADDNIIAQNKALTKIQNKGILQEPVHKAEVTPEYIAESELIETQAQKNIRKRIAIIEGQVIEQTKSKLTEIQSHDFEINEEDSVDLIIDACKNNNIDMDSILESAVMRKYKSWNEKQSFQLDNEVLFYGEYLTNGGKEKK